MKSIGVKINKNNFVKQDERHRCEINICNNKIKGIDHFVLE